MAVAFSIGARCATDGVPRPRLSADLLARLSGDEFVAPVPFGSTAVKRP